MKNFGVTENSKGAIERLVLAAEGFLVGLFLVPILQAWFAGLVVDTKAALIAVAMNPLWLFTMAWATVKYGGVRNRPKMAVAWGAALLLAWPGFMLTLIALTSDRNYGSALAVSQAMVAAPMGLICGLLWTPRNIK